MAINITSSGGSFQILNGTDLVRVTTDFVTVMVSDSANTLTIGTQGFEPYSLKYADIGTINGATKGADAVAVAAQLISLLPAQVPPSVTEVITINVASEATKAFTTDLSNYDSVRVMITGTVAGTGSFAIQEAESIDGVTYVDITGATLAGLTGVLTSLVPTGTLSGKYLRLAITNTLSPTGTITCTLLAK